MNTMSYLILSKNMICAKKNVKNIARTKCKIYRYSQENYHVTVYCYSQEKYHITIYKKNTMLLLFLREIRCPYLLLLTRK